MADPGTHPHVFINDPHGTMTLPTDNMEYEMSLHQLEMELMGSTPFVSRDYAGHMNYDITRPHVDAYVAALKYNQNQVALESSPVTTGYELKFIQRMRELIGYDHKSWGYVSTGGTTSTLLALMVARDRSRAAGRRDNIVLGSTLSHYSVAKACRVLDLVYRACPVDARGRMVLSELSGVVAIVVGVGHTETGTVDDVSNIVDAAHRRDIYVHADAAYGGYFMFADPSVLSEDTVRSLRAVKLCDSVSIDPHKMGYAPYGCGVFMLRDGTNRRHIDTTGGVGYIDTHVSSSTTIEGSRSGSMITSVYFGHESMLPLYPKIMTNLRVAASRLRGGVQGIGFSVYPATDLSIVLFRPISTIPANYFVTRFTDTGNAGRNHLQLVTTTIDGEVYFRIVVMDPHFGDYVDEFILRLKSEYETYVAEYEAFTEARVQRLLGIAEECDDKDDLRRLIASYRKFTAYNGFEPSGRIHIAQALITVMNTNEIVACGGRMIIYIADWFAQLNHKMGGDLDKIREVGRYFIEVFKSCGINLIGTEFIWASDWIGSHPGYLPRVLDVSTVNSLARMRRCCQIMGRSEGDELSSSQIIYPCMQCADVFELVPGGVDICQLGVDQRKVNMLAREYAGKRGLKMPIILSHHMLMGLKGPNNKMSKSDPKSAIFMEDDAETVTSKMLSAFCNDEVVGNPIFDYIKYIVLRWFGRATLCGVEYMSIDAVAAAFPSMDKRQLKLDVAGYINRILDPVRAHFEQPVMKELAARVASYRVTK